MKSNRKNLAAPIVLAIISLIMGALAAGPLAVSLLVGRTRFGPGQIVYFLLCFVGFVLPGLLYVFVAFHLNRQRLWAAILGIVTATVHAAAALIVLGIAIYGSRFVGAFVIVPMISGCVLIAASLWTIVQMSRALRELQELQAQQQAGFRPIMAGEQGGPST